MKWHKGFFGFFAPVWVADPYGQCWIKPRHIGHLLFPVAEFIVQSVNVALSMIDAHHQPHFPVFVFEETYDHGDQGGVA